MPRIKHTQNASKTQKIDRFNAMIKFNGCQRVEYPAERFTCDEYHAVFSSSFFSRECCCVVCVLCMCCIWSSPLSTEIFPIEKVTIITLCAIVLLRVCKILVTVFHSLLLTTTLTYTHDDGWYQRPTTETGPAIAVVMTMLSSAKTTVAIDVVVMFGMFFLTDFILFLVTKYVRFLWY